MGGKAAFGTQVTRVTCWGDGHGEKAHTGPELFNSNTPAGLLGTQGFQQGLQCFTH